MFAVVTGNFNGGGKPHFILVRGDIAQRPLKRFDPMALANQIGMEWDAHNRPAFATFFQ
jgi:hypothetical protein